MTTQSLNEEEQERMEQIAERYDQEAPTIDEQGAAEDYEKMIYNAVYNKLVETLKEFKGKNITQEVAQEVAAKINKAFNELIEEYELDIATRVDVNEDHIKLTLLKDDTLVESILEFDKLTNGDLLV